MTKAFDYTKREWVPRGAVELALELMEEGKSLRVKGEPLIEVRCDHCHKYLVATLPKALVWCRGCRRWTEAKPQEAAEETGKHEARL